MSGFGYMKKFDMLRPNYFDLLDSAAPQDSWEFCKEHKKGQDIWIGSNRNKINESKKIDTYFSVTKTIFRWIFKYFMYFFVESSIFWISSENIWYNQVEGSKKITQCLKYTKKLLGNL